MVYQTARDKLYLPALHFRSLLLRLLGDTNYDKVCDAVSQVEKSYARDARKEKPVATRNFMRAERSSPRSLRGFYAPVNIIPWPPPPPQTQDKRGISGGFAAFCLHYW